MNEPEFLELVAVGEARGVELKGPMSLSDKSTLKVVRAAMALSNRRDGGHIILGIQEQKGSQPTFVGLSDEQAGTWTYDDIADKFEIFAEPRIEFAVLQLTYDSKPFAVLRITEFTDVPIVCKKDSEDTAAGACYVYPTGKAEVRPIPSLQDMRELLDLAAEKRLRHMLGQVGRAGGEVTSSHEPSKHDMQTKEFFG